ncbi:MAG: aldo/keto reductase [Anaerolineae bacterium]|nr:aldo/keto reductase [Anaerolineae bacterium]
MGTWAIADSFTWGKQDEDDARAAIEVALEVGINFFDTAEGYGAGRSEELLGEALAPHRREVVIASKVSQHNLNRAAVREACEASLRRLQTDYIDLYQIHWASRETPLAETWEALAELKAAGKIRAIGVSNFGLQDLTEALAAGPVTSNQVPYNLLWRAIEHTIQPKCVAHGVGILAYSPLMQSLLTGKFASADEVPETRARTRLFSTARPHTRHGEAGQEAAAFAAIDAVRNISREVGASMAEVALAWVAHQPGVASVLAGARNPAQVRQNSAAAGLTLAPDVIEALNRATDPLKQALGPNPDMWLSESRYR